MWLQFIISWLQIREAFLDNQSGTDLISRQYLIVGPGILWGGRRSSFGWALPPAWDFLLGLFDGLLFSVKFALLAPSSYYLYLIKYSSFWLCFSPWGLPDTFWSYRSPLCPSHPSRLGSRASSTSICVKTTWRSCKIHILCSKPGVRPDICISTVS